MTNTSVVSQAVSLFVEQDSELCIKQGSVNYEIGAKMDSADKRFTTRLALFYAIKNNERNRNPGWAAPSFVTADVMAEYAFEKFTLKTNVSNVTNKLYADALYTGNYIPGAGRVYALTASVKF